MDNLVQCSGCLKFPLSVYTASHPYGDICAECAPKFSKYYIDNQKIAAKQDGKLSWSHWGLDTFSLVSTRNGLIYIENYTGDQQLFQQWRTEMANNSFSSRLKGDSISAGYRVASTQTTKLVKSSLIKILKENGMTGEKLAVAAEFLDTDAGSAIIAMALGYTLTYMPKISDNDKVARLAQEFRIDGMAKGANLLVEGTISYLLPSIAGVIGSLPKPESEETVQVRIHEDEPAQKVESVTTQSNQDEAASVVTEQIAKVA
jgi:hypothetical protein